MFKFAKARPLLHQVWGMGSIFVRMSKLFSDIAQFEKNGVPRQLSPGWSAKRLM